MDIRRRNILIIAVVGIGLIIAISVFGVININLAPVFTLVLYAGLIVVTMVYAYYTMEVAEATQRQAEATRQQADASVKMAEEMKEQRIMESRPVIIQKAIAETETKFATFGSKDWFSHFEVFNAGKGSAIEVEISLLNKQKDSIHSQRKTFLRAGEPPIEFSPDELITLEKTKYYLICEYQSIFSRAPQPTWYQTCLPFETIESNTLGKIYVKPGELEFKEVTEKERIDAFQTRSKPK
jgi:hypothetical protein